VKVTTDDQTPRSWRQLFRPPSARGCIDQSRRKQSEPAQRVRAPRRDPQRNESHEQDWSDPLVHWSAAALL